MAGYALIEAVKERTEFKSDYAIANEIGVGRSNISNWKNSASMPDAITALKIAKLGNIETKEALKLLQSGFSTVSLLVMTALASIAGLAFIHSAASLYIM